MCSKIGLRIDQYIHSATDSRHVSGIGQLLGRLEIGARVPSFTCTTRLVNGSDEYAKLVAQTTGTAVLSVNNDANNSAQWTWQQISYQVVENTAADGIVAVTVTVAPQYNVTNGVLTFVGKCGITGIAQ